jgi:hypothetical protein
VDYEALRQAMADGPSGRPTSLEGLPPAAGSPPQTEEIHDV